MQSRQFEIGAARRLRLAKCEGALNGLRRARSGVSDALLRRGAFRMPREHCMEEEAAAAHG
jgi:hypothetical protein